jgi:hypothetical protein
MGHLELPTAPAARLPPSRAVRRMFVRPAPAAAMRAARDTPIPRQDARKPAHRARDGRTKRPSRCAVGYLSHAAAGKWWPPRLGELRRFDWGGVGCTRVAHGSCVLASCRHS